MDWLNVVQKAIHYIEENIMENINSESISNSVYASNNNFQKVFSVITGYSISEYIRNRKLSLAGKELFCKKAKVVDIALKYGYDTHESFTKAFTRFHGITPMEARLSEINQKYFSPLSIQINIKGGFNMERKLIANIRNLIDGMQGHNYALPDCLKFIFECLGDYEELNFWDFAALTGDTVVQVYNHNLTTGCEYCVSGYLAGAEHIGYVFDTLGYNYEYIDSKQINNDITIYSSKIVEYINKGIPILVKTNLNDIEEWKSDVGSYCLIVGYENEGKLVKLLIEGTKTIDYSIVENNKLDLVFIGEKKYDVSLEQIYLQIIDKMHYWLTLPERNGMSFGAVAYRAWADDIISGRFEAENFDLWGNYGVYVVNLATNGGGPWFILNKLAALNQNYSKLSFTKDKIHSLLPAESPTGEGKVLLWIKLDELGGGMDMNAVKTTMCDKEKRAKVADVFYDYAERLDQVVELIKNFHK